MDEAIAHSCETAAPAAAVAQPAGPLVALPAPLGLANMVVEAQPGHLKPDDQAKKEKASLFGKLAEDGTARVIGVYIDIGLRAAMALLFWLLTAGWLIGVIVILCRQDPDGKAHKLSDAVLITLLTTTTLNVLGLLTAVAVYLFPRKSQEKLADAAQADAK